MLKPTRNKRRIAALAGALALSTCLALGLAGCANSEGNGAAEPTAPATEQEANADAQAATEAESGAITFTDDLGRTVELPAQIDKICPSGFTAQQVLLTMAPDKMVGLAQELNDDQLKIFGEKFADYPVFGAVLGAKDDLNREAVPPPRPRSSSTPARRRRAPRRTWTRFRSSWAFRSSSSRRSCPITARPMSASASFWAWKSAAASCPPTAPTCTT